ncbi:MAG: sulfatase-like hydrolase/transferase [Bacteroidetes bacterium]|nr:sulfatase-like hydrolase/transferase [Bacteroidota bacterium]
MVNKQERVGMRYSIVRGMFVLGCLFSMQTLFSQDGTKKNLLFIITDQQRYDALGYAGNSVINTPNLDRLAEQGAFFRNAYTPCAVCGPARSSILTGYTVEGTGVNSNIQTYYHEGEGVMDMPTFDEILAQNGYHCEYYGKWHALSSHAGVYENPVQYAENGNSVFGPGGQSHIWRDYLDIYGPPPAPGAGEFIDGMSKWPYVVNPLDRYFEMSWQELQNQGIKHSQPDQHGELLLDKEHTMTAFQARQTLEAIERLKDTTFSISCSFHFPHSPMLGPKPYYGMYPVADMIPPVSISDPMSNSPYTSSNSREKRTEYADPELIKYMISEYYGLITEIDDWVGLILDKLDTLGIADETLIIFTSDHGEMLGAHGMREKNIFYEESAHIPLLIRFPGEVPAATTVEGYISLVDLFPTILDYLAVDERESEGKSLRGLIEKSDTIHGKYVVTEWDRDNISNYMVVKDGWKLIIPYTIKSAVINAMYDLNTDPHEMNNLLGTNPERGLYQEKAEELRACLLEWLAEKNSVHYYSVSQRDLMNGGKPTGNNAAFVSQEVPELLAGDTMTVSIIMKNTGVSAWTKSGQFKLGSRSPADNETWGLKRVEFSEGDSIVPGQEKTFTFDITVPEADGIFIFQWQMVQDGEEWFGAKTDLKQVISGNPGSYLDPCDEKTDWKSSAGLNLNTTDHQQGTGCLEFSGASTDEFKKVFSPPYNSRGSVKSTELKFWYYVSDVSQFESGNQVEIGSAGKHDEDEYSWNLSGLTDGWNLITLKVNEAGVSGTPDLDAINWFRIYHKKSGSVTTRLDGIQIVDTEAGPVYTLLVNSGYGGGSYFEAEEVTITASPAFGSTEFDKWVVESGDPIIADSSSSTTTLTMGTQSAIISATYKETVSVPGRQASSAAVEIYPNPSNSEFTVAVTLERSTEVYISLLDLSGRKVGKPLNVKLNPGLSALKFPVLDVNPGAYIIRSAFDGHVHTELVIIQ